MAGESSAAARGLSGRAAVPRADGRRTSDVGRRRPADARAQRRDAGPAGPAGSRTPGHQARDGPGRGRHARGGRAVGPGTPRRGPGRCGGAHGAGPGLRARRLPRPVVARRRGHRSPARRPRRAGTGLLDRRRAAGPRVPARRGRGRRALPRGRVRGAMRSLCVRPADPRGCRASDQPGDRGPVRGGGAPRRARRSWRVPPPGRVVGFRGQRPRRAGSEVADHHAGHGSCGRPERRILPLPRASQAPWADRPVERATTVLAERGA